MLARYGFLPIMALLVALSSGCLASPATVEEKRPSDPVTLKLPEPRLDSSFSVEKSLHQRRSIREYAAWHLRLSDVSQLLWAAQGITTDWGGRTAPSAGALYPLEVYLVANRVEGLTPGIYRYLPKQHALSLVKSGNFQTDLSRACLGQTWVEDASINIVISAVYQRTTAKYGERGVRYVHIEVGHAAQNIYLQATALGLGTVAVGAFDDERVKEIVGLPENEEPLYVLPVGKTK